MTPDSLPETEEPRSPNRWPRIVALAFGLLALTFVVAGIWSSSTYSSSPTLSARVDIHTAKMALDMYRDEFGSYPSGSHVEIMRALFGANAKNMRFLEYPPGVITASGELLDPWGTAYRIDTSDPAKPRVYSFGKNKHDDGGAKNSDDVSYPP